MSSRTAAEDGAGDEPWSEDGGGDLPDEVDERADEDDDGLDEDDLPATHMSDAEYDAYAARTFDAEGRERGGPPVGAILIGITLLVVLLAVLLA